MTLRTQAPQPLADALSEALGRGSVSFSTPGHKRSHLVGHDAALQRDMTLLCGIEDQQLSRDLLGQAERLAARAWGAERTRFSVQGSTHPNLAAALALTSGDRPVLVARTSHKSVLAGLVLSGARPHWLLPRVSSETGLALGVAPEELAEALAAEPNAAAVWLPDPNYAGVCSDIGALAAVAHEHGVPLLVDQAWGAHFGFHPDLPPAAATLGADLTIISVHKTLTAFSQGAMLHLTGTLIPRDRLMAAFDGLHTTSPAGVILASLDAARALMEARGEELLDGALALAADLRAGLRDLPGVTCVDGHGWPSDPLKVVIDVTGTGLSGFDVERRLRADGIQLLMADDAHLVVLLTIGDGPSDVRALLDALTRVVAAAGDGAPRRSGASIAWRVRPELAMTPREAFLAEHETVSARAAVGRIAAETIAPYPPGVPAVAPGEVLTGELVHALRREAAAGTRITGPADVSLRTFRVIAGRSGAPAVSG